MQLQLVLIAWLLARQRSGDASLAAPDAPDAGRARKRKAARPTRWTGLAPAPPLAFVWDAARTRARTDAPTDLDTPGADAASPPPPPPRADAPLSPDARLGVLPQIWDALGDQLCLLECAPPATADAAYGSASRLRDVNDMRDEAQWVCAAVLEPAFRAVLPRECARLRTKCFGPGPSAAT